MVIRYIPRNIHFDAVLKFRVQFLKFKDGFFCIVFIIFNFRNQIRHFTLTSCASKFWVDNDSRTWNSFIIYPLDTFLAKNGIAIFQSKAIAVKKHATLELRNLLNVKVCNRPEFHIFAIVTFLSWIQATAKLKLGFQKLPKLNRIFVSYSRMC